MTTQRADLDLKAWPFWRKRLARLLVLGGLVFAATRVLPNVPQEQNVVFRAPPRHDIERLLVSYRKAGDSEAMGGTRLVPSHPMARLPHEFALPSGSYVFTVAAETVDAAGQRHLLDHEARVELREGRAFINLPSP